MEKPEEKDQSWLDPMTVQPRVGSIHPAPFGETLAGRGKRALGAAVGLTQFGVNLVTLPPGSWSSQRHWHAKEDEFVYVVRENWYSSPMRGDGSKIGHGGGLPRRQSRWTSPDQSK